MTREIRTEKRCGLLWSAADCRRFFLPQRLLTQAVFRRNGRTEMEEKREQAPALQKSKTPRPEPGRSLLRHPLYESG